MLRNRHGKEQAPLPSVLASYLASIANQKQTNLKLANRFNLTRPLWPNPAQSHESNQAPSTRYRCGDLPLGRPTTIRPLPPM